MSDIAIRFDGLLLAGCLALGACIYVAVALGAGIIGLSRGRKQRQIWQFARTPLLFGILTAAALAVLLIYIEQMGPPTTGPDWLDWLSLPYALLFIGGCVAIFRRTPV